jgi:hypothetical protein
LEPKLLSAVATVFTSLRKVKVFAVFENKLQKSEIAEKQRLLQIAKQKIAEQRRFLQILMQYCSSSGSLLKTYVKA